MDQESAVSRRRVWHGSCSGPGPTRCSAPSSIGRGRRWCWATTGWSRTSPARLATPSRPCSSRGGCWRRSSTGSGGASASSGWTSSASGWSAMTGRPVMVWLLRGLPRADILRVIDALEDEVGFDEAAARGLLPMTWEMLARMQRAGVVIGSHTRTHAWLTLEDREKALEELGGSRLDLESRLGITVRHFAYPDGRFNKDTAAMVAAAGYRFGYTTCCHRDSSYPLLTIPRRMLWQNACLDDRGRFSAAILSCQVHGVFNLVRGCEQNHAA